MAKCTYCGMETPLHARDVPVCVPCADLTPERRTIRAKLFHEWGEAAKRTDSAYQAFIEVTTRIPSGMPHSDGMQRIKNVSRLLNIARTEMIAAHKRLNDFVERGIVPEDLRKSS